MDKDKAVVWYFPIILCTVSSTIFFTVKYGRPVSGLVSGFVVGFILALITYLLYNDFYCNDVVPGFTRGDCPSIDSFDELLKVPYYFFYMWLNPVFMLGGCLLQVLLVIGAIGVGIWFIVHLISSGL